MNSIGERIYELRKQNNMLQGDLADKLDVSRQTISKWENNSSLPEVEKLIQLSEIFGVSTDYILKIDEKKSDPVYIYVKDTDSENIPKHNETIVRKYVGIVLSAVFTLITVFLIIAGGEILAIPPGAVAALGILLACNVKHPWLTVSWLTYVITIAVLPFFTAINPLLIFDPILYTEGYLAPLVITYAVWIIFFILIFCTVTSISKGRKKQSKLKSERSDP